MILGEIDISCVLNTQKGRLGEVVIYFFNDYLFFVYWQVKALGKEHRERKWVTYNENILAFVAYSKPHSGRGSRRMPKEAWKTF
jgi:hypothetical protein